MSDDEAKHAVDPLSGADDADVLYKGKGAGLGKVGIGIPFLIQTVDEHAGGWNLHTEKGAGTTFAVWFDTGSIETPPSGDIAALFTAALLSPGPKEMIIRRLRKTGAYDIRYEIRKTELTEAVGGLDDPGSIMLLSAYLRSLEGNEPITL
jgi:hypothetical protein